MLTLTEQQVRRLRLRANGLCGAACHAAGSKEASLRVATVARRLAGVQAQDRAAAELAWQPRSRRLLREDVAGAIDGAPEHKPTLARTWAMRGTLHLLALEDAGWLLALLGPLFVKKGRRRRRQLGLDDATCARTTALLRELLAGGKALTRSELGEALGAEGIPVEGQALYHLLFRAALEGVVCFGPDRDGEHTFVLLQDWLGVDVKEAALAPQEATARVARRYLQGYGPVTVNDFARWSGLGLRQSRRAFEELRPELYAAQTAAGQRLFLLQAQAAWLDEPDRDERPVRLLPAFDSFLLGYESRAFIVSDDHQRRIHPGGGLIRPTVLLNGRAVANWRLRRKSGKVEVDIDYFGEDNGLEADVVSAEAQAMRRYVSGAAAS